MSNCRFPDSFTVAAQCMRVLRNKSKQEQPDLSAAWYEAQRELDEMYPPPESEVVVQQAMVQTARLPEHVPPPRKPHSFEHIEKRFTLASGKVLSCCTHPDCNWTEDASAHDSQSRIDWRKTHSDGCPRGAYPDFDLPTVEASEDGEGVEVAELTLTPHRQARVAGEDEPDKPEVSEGEIAEEGLIEVTDAE